MRNAVSDLFRERFMNIPPNLKGHSEALKSAETFVELMDNTRQLFHMMSQGGFGPLWVQIGVAGKFLHTICPSEAKVESSFWYQKRIHTQLRNSLLSENVEAEVMMRMNGVAYLKRAKDYSDDVDEHVLDSDGELGDD